MKVFVADNQIRDLTNLTWLLARAFPNYTVWPEQDQPLTNWDKVTEALQEHTENSKEQTIVLDLGIESETRQSVRTGVEIALQLRALRPNAVFVAHTQWPEMAQADRRYDEIFDGLIDKQALGGFDSVEEQVRHVRVMIQAATRHRTGDTPSYGLVDSIGIRTAIAALGRDAFDALVEEVGEDWADRQVSALTSGHSGAFVLLVSGNDNGGRRQVVVKCAREREIIQAESEGFWKHLGELGPLAEVLAPIEQQLNPLPQRRGFYYRQDRIQGQTLGALFRSGNDAAGSALERVLDLELRCYQSCLESACGKSPPENCFPLNLVDVERAEQSLSFLRDIGNWATQHGQWPEILPDIETTTRDVKALLLSWTNALSELDDFELVSQHGDLNIENVIVPDRGNFVLIDLARLGRWPLGYDIGRLSVMLRIRLTDHENNRDWAENRLRTWITDPFCNVGPESEGGASNCVPAENCDRAFHEFVNQVEPARRQGIVRGYKVGVLWDLVKVLSYGDLSPFKRVWVLGAVWQVSKELKLMNATS